MAFNPSGGVSGASSGAAFGPYGAIIGGLLGAFGGGPSLPPEIKRAYKLQLRASKGLQRFAGSVPLSDPLEQAALAQQRGQLGEQQRAQAGQLYGAQGGFAQTSPGDFLRGLTSMQIGQQGALSSQHLLAALAARRNALTQSADVARGAASTVSGQYQQGAGAGLGDLFGNLAQLYAYKQGLGTSGGGGGLGGRDGRNRGIYGGGFGGL